VGKVVKAIAAVGLTAAGVFTGGLTLPLGLGVISGGTLLTLGLTLGASLLLPGPKIPRAQLSRLNISMDVAAPRKFVLGKTAFPLDLRYHEATGTNQEYIHYIIAHAAHKVQSIEEIWFEQDLAWSASGGVTAKYAGYLTVATRLEGAAGNEINISANWGPGRRLTGCAYTYIRIKRTGNSKKAESPLVSGLPSRVTVIGKGAPLYDPRRDSTVPGGNGPHRINDQSTWGTGYSPADSYDNPALQLLWFLLGWKINGKLSVGCGVPPSRIDLASFIEAANICDEQVALAGGGTQRRYRASGAGSDADDRMEIIKTLCASMNATLRDNTGRLSLKILRNDLAEYVLDLNDNDILGPFNWQQTGSLSESYNVVRGRYVDPSPNSLYQMVDYPEVRAPSPDGIERVLSYDLPFVQDGIRAQRIAKQVLARNQYRGRFSATFGAKALGCDIGEIVRLSVESLGFSNKLFRVVSKQITMEGKVPLELLEENAAIYAWNADEAAVVQAAAPTVYDPLNSPFILAAAEAGGTALWENITGAGKPEDNADVTALAQRTISGPTSVSFTYTSTGTLDPSAQMPANLVYTLSNQSGPITSGVTWQYRVVEGTVNGYSASSTLRSMSGSGAGTLTINSLGSTSKVEIVATQDGRTVSLFVTLEKVLLAPSTGGSGGAQTATQTSGFSNVTSSSYATISNELQVTAGTTTQTVTVNIEVWPPYGGYGTIEIQVERWNGSSWVTMGSSESASNGYYYDPEANFYWPYAAGFNFQRTAMISSNTVQKARVRARLASGSGTHSVFGTLTLSA